MKDFLKQLVQDKNGNYSLREVVTVVQVLIMLLSWAAQQFLGKAVPEFMFYTLASLVAAGCFGYSLEKRSFDASSSNPPSNNP